MKNPWLVSFPCPFQDPEEFVYPAVEYVPGGDFRTLLNNLGVLKEVHARFYIGEGFAAVTVGIYSSGSQTGGVLP